MMNATTEPSAPKADPKRPSQFWDFFVVVRELLELDIHAKMFWDELEEELCIYSSSTTFSISNLTEIAAKTMLARGWRYLYDKDNHDYNYYFTLKISD